MQLACSRQRAARASEASALAEGAGASAHSATQLAFALGSLRAPRTAAPSFASDLAILFASSTPQSRARSHARSQNVARSIPAAVAVAVLPLEAEPSARAEASSVHAFEMEATAATRATSVRGAMIETTAGTSFRSRCLSLTPRPPGVRVGDDMTTNEFSCRVASRALALVVLAGLATSAAPVADACENGVEITVDPRAASIAAAEQLVQAGDPEAAYARLMAADPRMARRSPGEGPLTDRGLVVLARAAVRSDGALHPDTRGASPDGKAAARERAMGWAVSTLHALAKKRSDDPVLQTDLGEAMTRVEARRGEGLAILERLESKDLVASAYGYAALARARASVPDALPGLARGPLRAMTAPRRALEQARCAAMTKKPEICAPVTR